MQVSHVLIGIKQKLVEGRNGSWVANVRMSWLINNNNVIDWTIEIAKMVEEKNTKKTKEIQAFMVQTCTYLFL
jgi:hypothetical protein